MKIISDCFLSQNHFSASGGYIEHNRVLGFTVLQRIEVNHTTFAIKIPTFNSDLFPHA